MKPDWFNYLWEDVINHSQNYQPYDRFASPNSNRRNAGYRPYNSSSNADLLNDLLKDNYEYNRSRDTNATRIVEDLPASYIDGGIILKKGITITRNDFINMERDEWEEFSALIENIPNISCDEVLDQQLLWIYDKPPVITSMAA